MHVHAKDRTAIISISTEAMSSARVVTIRAVDRCGIVSQNRSKDIPILSIPGRHTSEDSLITRNNTSITNCRVSSIPGPVIAILIVAIIVAFLETSGIALAITIKIIICMKKKHTCFQTPCCQKNDQEVSNNK